MNTGPLDAEALTLGIETNWLYYLCNFSFHFYLLLALTISINSPVICSCFALLNKILNFSKTFLALSLADFIVLSINTGPKP